VALRSILESDRLPRATCFRALMFAIVCHSSALPSLCQSSTLTLTSPAQAQLEKSASEAAKRFGKVHIAIGSAVLVVDFANLDDKNRSQLGVALADQFSNAIQSYVSNFTVVPRNALQDYLHTHLLEGEETRNQEVAKWLAERFHAEGVIQGTIELLSNGELKLLLRVLGPGPSHSVEARLPAQPEFRGLFAQVVPSFAPEPEKIGEEPGVYQEHDPGVVMPAHVCIFCPNPDYTNLARKAKYQGDVKLSAVLGTDGKVSAIRVTKFAPFDLTDQAIEAVRTWRMNPYTKDGNAVPVRVDIEIVFRLLN